MVRLKPSGGKLRFDPEDFQWPWRDLERDIGEGRTIWALMKGLPKGGVPFPVLLAWALGHRVVPGQDPVPQDLYAVYDLLNLAPQARPDAITQLALHLAHRMGDMGSVRWYMKLLWAVAEGRLSPHLLVTQLERALADRREGWARRARALLASRLKGVVGM
ncbi:MAG: hypothetical protein RML14_10910 [Meiothermus sp.]|nr:hypothetical protein [Meiothermus sp.]MDW8482352.1 hypothetical protein [Meiothermus sp.]